MAAHLLRNFFWYEFVFPLVGSNSSCKSLCFCSESWSCYSKSEVFWSAPFICFSNDSFCKSKHECRSMHSAVFRSSSFWNLERDHFKTWHSWQEKFEGLASVFCFLGAGSPSGFVTSFFGGVKTKHLVYQSFVFILYFFCLICKLY